MTVPDVPLTSDVRAPQLGLGTWTLRGPDCQRVVERALALGYRHLDTAHGYGNERDVGRAVAASDTPRAHLFITSKVWRDDLEPRALRRTCEESLGRLGADYLDLLLIHWPNSAIPIARTIDGFRDLRDRGLIRAWGASNFTAAHLREAVAVARPATNQVELHPYFNQRELRAVCRDLRVPITAYTPLAKGHVMDDPTLRRIGDAHARSPAQVALRWSLQHGHLVIPKASSDGHLRANLDVFDFALSDAQMRDLDRRPQRPRMVDGDWSEFDRPDAGADPLLS